MKRALLAFCFPSYCIDDFLPGVHTVTARREGFQAVTVCPICEFAPRLDI